MTAPGELPRPAHAIDQTPPGEHARAAPAPGGLFDEVIELHWMRWRTEWEQTLAALSAQPAPGLGASPVIGYRSH